MILVVTIIITVSVIRKQQHDTHCNDIDTLKIVMFIVLSMTTATKFLNESISWEKNLHEPPKYLCNNFRSVRASHITK